MEKITRQAATARALKGETIAVIWKGNCRWFYVANTEDQVEAINDLAESYGINALNWETGEYLD